MERDCCPQGPVSLRLILAHLPGMFARRIEKYIS